MARGQSEALLPMVERVVKAAGIAMQDIDRIAVTVGPGSFTGLRIGIAAARGLALALARPAVGVSTLAAFAAPALVSGASLPVAGAIDARHGMVFFQFMGNDGRVIAGPGLFSIEEAALKTGDGAMIFVGDAADRLAAAKKEMAPAFQIGRGTVIQAAAPDIAWPPALPARCQRHAFRT
jgi:tRNA threonylcarbamoyladenosine biosynthesis protein TsaB